MTKPVEGVSEKIIACAKEEFLKKGYSDASLRTIAAKAGTTTGSIYSRFQDKEGLFSAIVEPAADHLVQRFLHIQETFHGLEEEQQPKEMKHYVSSGMVEMIDYIYDHYDNFRLLLKCGDSGKFEDFIHNMVEREVEASQKYMKAMCDAGIEFPAVSKSLMHMIYTGFFSSVLQVIEHDMDRETAKKNVYQLREFQTGGWERLWNIKFPAEDK